jgi:hypothetical protein
MDEDTYKDPVRHERVLERELADLTDAANWQTAARQMRRALLRMAGLIDQLGDRCEALEEQLDDEQRQDAAR